MRIQYIIHADFELPGIIEDWGSEKRFVQSFVRPFAGERLPSEISFDMLVLMGGPQSPLELDKFPYLKQEIDLTARAIQADKVVLGFCLGAQIIGEALGARTEHSPHNFGNESQFTQELGIYISIFTIPNYLNLDRWEIEYSENQKLVNLYSSRGDADAKAAFLFVSKPLNFEPRNIKQQQQLLAHAYSDLGWEVSKLLEIMADARDFYFNSVAQIKMDHWSKGRVVLDCVAT